MNGLTGSGVYYTAVMTKILVGDVITLSAGANYAAAPWGSAQATGVSNVGGGVVAIIANQILMSDNSKITADGAGFSGGPKIDSNIVQGCGFCFCVVNDYVCDDQFRGGMKGASIAPYSENPNNRKYCRGATANGGGGGNNHNSGGGGGANVCTNSALGWTGAGVSIRFNNKNSHINYPKDTSSW